MKIAYRFAHGDAQPAVAKRKRMARVYEIETDERLVPCAEMQDARICLIVQSAASPTVSRRRFARTNQKDGSEIAVDDPSANCLAVRVRIRRDPLKVWNRLCGGRIDPGDHRKRQPQAACDSHTPRRDQGSVNGRIPSKPARLVAMYE